MAPAPQNQQAPQNQVKAHAAFPGNDPGGQAVEQDMVITASALEKEFFQGKKHIRALAGLNLTIAPKQVTGLIGPDGAGKTTFMRLCAGLLKPSAGTLQVLGLDTVEQTLQVQARIGYMPQRFGLYQDLSVQENLDLFANLHGLAHDQRPGRYQRLMEMSGLGPFQGRLAGKLSGGMKQKLGLMCTLVASPELLLLDEPTVGVDPVSRRELWQIVYHLVQEEGLSVLLSTAYLDEAERCAAVALIHQGSILGQGTPKSFSAKMIGRTWQLQPGPTLSRRRLQQQLLQQPAVLDALVQGSSLRLVTRQDADLDTQDLFGADEIAIEPVPPRFEDYFLAALKEQAGDATGGVDATPGQESKRLQPLSTPVQARGAAASATQDTAREMIRAENLVRRFGSFVAVDQVSFRVEQGEIFGLLGANGAGKTTTFRMLCGLLPISSGLCTVAGVNLRSAASTARAKIGYMAQKFSLYGNLSVMHNLRFFSSAYGLAGKQRSKRIQWALDSFDLHDFTDTPSQALPLGYKQRLALAVALMHGPEVLFLDEPTSGVDPLARREFWQLINQVAEQGVTVLVTTHFMEEAEHCDRLVIMAEGRVLAEGTPEHMKREYGGHAEASMEDAFIGLVKNKQHQEAGS
jgi:ABC-2 type transport system ATP-binding protein